VVFSLVLINSLVHIYIISYHLYESTMYLSTFTTAHVGTNTGQLNPIIRVLRRYRRLSLVNARRIRPIPQV
jgi:hypothetical protein